MKVVEGGVCAAKGFLANGLHCGIRANKDKKDLSLIYSQVPAAAAATYTTNLVKGAPLLVTKEHIASGYAQAIICNSGNANTCNADGLQVANQMCELAAKALNIDGQDVLVASTGVIGQPLCIDPIADSVDELAAGLNAQGCEAAAEGIMTTDTKKKIHAVSFDIDGVQCIVGGMAKGSGMIHPNMATMLVFITTDVAISPELLQRALSEDIKDSFNMISVDGDTSTNDMVVVLANGLANNELIVSEGPALDAFKEALSQVTTYLCRCIAQDGEGATKLLECSVSGAASKDVARCVAKSVVCSSLTKAAMFGADANWGRVLCAIGYSGADLDVNKVDVSFASSAGNIVVCQQGAGVAFSEELAKEILLQDSIEILVNLNAGSDSATAFGCDLTYEYVKINGDYRT